MAITLGPITFPDRETSVEERYEEVAGRDERVIKISGVILEPALSDVENRLDAILDAASVDDFSAELSLRDGRRLWVRRDGYKRQVSRDPMTGAFELTLSARDPFEESVSVTAVPWSISASGATSAFASAGNVYSKPVIALTASGTIVNPSFSDGVRTMSYSGTVQDGETLVIDAETGRVELDGVDVTPYADGLAPRLEPEGTTLTYTDDPSSSHTAEVVVAFRDRWW